MSRSIPLQVKLGCLSVLTAAVVVGCNAERSADIPSNAQLVAEGTNKITYTAPRDGMVWVFNQFNKNIEWGGGVKGGDTVLVDPDADKIFINGHNVNDKPLTNDSKRIFFQADSTVVIQRTTPAVIERSQVVDPVTGQVLRQTTTAQPGDTVREYRTVRP